MGTFQIYYGTKKPPTYKVNGFQNSVRKKGLEPPRLAAPDPKSGAATNYATSAFLLVGKGKLKSRKQKRYFKNLNIAPVFFNNSATFKSINPL